MSDLDYRTLAERLGLEPAETIAEQTANLNDYLDEREEGLAEPVPPGGPTASLLRRRAVWREEIQVIEEALLEAIGRSSR